MTAQKWGTPLTLTTLTTTDAAIAQAANYHQTGGTDLVIDNTTTKELFIVMEIVGTWAATPTEGGLFRVWLLPSLDGTNYSDGGSVTPSTQHSLALPVRAVTTSQRVIAGHEGGVFIYPGENKVMFRNEAGSQLASGAVIKYALFSFDG